MPFKNLLVLILFLLMPLTVLAGELLIHVNEIVAPKNDFYVCSKVFTAKDPDIFVTQYSPKLNSTIVHHVLLFALK